MAMAIYSMKVLVDTAAAYGVNYARLKTIKAKYDPENVFHLNQNIQS